MTENNSVCFLNHFSINELKKFLKDHPSISWDRYCNKFKLVSIISEHIDDFMKWSEKSLSSEEMSIKKKTKPKKSPSLDLKKQVNKDNWMRYAFLFHTIPDHNFMTFRIKGLYVYRGGKKYSNIESPEYFICPAFTSDESSGVRSFSIVKNNKEIVRKSWGKSAEMFCFYSRKWYFCKQFLRVSHNQCALFKCHNRSDWYFRCGRNSFKSICGRYKIDKCPYRNTASFYFKISRIEDNKCFRSDILNHSRTTAIPFENSILVIISGGNSSKLVCPRICPLSKKPLTFDRKIIDTQAICMLSCKHVISLHAFSKFLKITDGAICCSICSKKSSSFCLVHKPVFGSRENPICIDDFCDTPETNKRKCSDNMSSKQKRLKNNPKPELSSKQKRLKIRREMKNLLETKENYTCHYGDFYWKNSSVYYGPVSDKEVSKFKSDCQKLVEFGTWNPVKKEHLIIAARYAGWGNMSHQKGIEIAKKLLCLSEEEFSKVVPKRKTNIHPDVTEFMKWLVGRTVERNSPIKLQTLAAISSGILELNN